jgi:hypothetical protein
MTTQKIKALVSDIDTMSIDEIEPMRTTVSMSLLSAKEKFYIYDALDAREFKINALSDNIAICSEFREDDIK